MPIIKPEQVGSVIGALTLLGVLGSPNAAQSATFTPPPNSTAPSQATGGASRGGFIPPTDNAAPQQATGGASRGVFTPPADNAAPQQATGGASRGVFTPPANNAAPQQATGGAARSTFTPPPASAAPQQAAGGAARSNTYGSYTDGDRPLSMAALLPTSFYGTTLAARPTILVYLPATSVRDAVFSIKDESQQMVYQMPVSLSGKAGVVSIQLPENAPALEVGKNYQWFFALKLDGGLSPRSPFVDGWIKRIAPSAELTQALEGKTPVQKSSILAAKGVWYDSAAILSGLRASQPTDLVLNKEWKELLDSVQLSQLVNLPSK